MEESFTLDGRKFRPVGPALTASQDDYILGHLRLSGALEALSGVDGIDRTNEAKAEQLLTRIMLSGRTSNVLAGCLVEEGKKWTRQEADRNAAIFAEISDGAEKLRMRAAVVRIVLGFFWSGKESSATSRKSSSPKGTGRATRSAEVAT